MRIISLLLALLFLSSCYQPVYGNKVWGGDATSQETRLNSIGINNIPDEEGQILRNALIDRMYGTGRPDKTTAQLNVQLTKVVENLGLQKDATTLRKKITYTASYALNDGAGKVLMNGNTKAFASYNYIDEQYGSLVSQESAAERALRELANLIVTRLLVYYGEKDNPVAPSPQPTPSPSAP